MGVMPTIAFVSDTHFSQRAPLAHSQWRAVLDALGEIEPDLVIHAGDIALDGPRDPADLDEARNELDEIPVPWRAVPGNHDLGDIGETSIPITPERLAAYRDRFGDGNWSVDLDGWRIIGLDVQALVGLPDTAEATWRWLGDALAGPGDGAAVSGRCLVLHRPILPVEDGEVDSPHRYLPEPARSRLLDLIESAGVDLVASGHVHQRRTFRHRGALHLWVPSVWATIPDERQPVIGVKETGIAIAELGESPEVRFVRPAGVAEAVIGVTFASPYGGH